MRGSVPVGLANAGMIVNMPREWYDTNRFITGGIDMHTVTKAEAIERIAKAVEIAPVDLLVDVYREFHPLKPRLKISEVKPEILARELVGCIRTDTEMDQMVDLWHVMFPLDRKVRWDEDDQVLRYMDRETWLEQYS